jgi:hypothetical protein
MSQYTVNLSQAENDALAYVAMSQDDWIQNAVHERCRVAIDEIVGIAVQNFLATGIQIPGTKEEIVALAFSTGLVKTAAERQAEAEAAAAAMAAQQAAEQAAQ